MLIACICANGNNDKFSENYINVRVVLEFRLYHALRDSISYKYDNNKFHKNFPSRRLAQKIGQRKRLNVVVS